MPLKLSVGLSKKIGLADYGSLGASCHVEVELDACLLAKNPTDFQQQAQQAFMACAEAVDDELARHGSPDSQANGHVPTNDQVNGQQQNGPSRKSGPSATTSQVRAILGIANRQRINLAQELQKRFGVDRPEELFIGDASRFIDDLKGASQKTGGE